MINHRTQQDEIARMIAEEDRDILRELAGAEPEHDTPQPDAEADMPALITAPYSRRLSPMQQTALMASGTTPQEVATHSLKANLPKRQHAKSAKAKSKRKQAKASRARNRK